MYCQEYNCLFVHIPKTAGKSIECFFLDLLGLSWEQRAPLLLRPNADPARGPERLAHMTAAEYVNLAYLTREQFDAAYRFSFVRNPWARLVSEYRYRKHYLRFSFSEFVSEHLPAAGMSDAYRHIVPQSDFLHGADGELLVNFVGRFENLQADFAEVCRGLGIEVGSLPHVKDPAGVSLSVIDRLRDRLGITREPHHAHYSSYYDEQTRDRVADMYASDIELFGYEFGTA